MLTRQEIFDKAVGGVIAQGALAMDGGACCYRTDDGRKCAVGHLIDDENYSRDMEGSAAPSPRVTEALERSGVVGSGNSLFLSALQQARDKSRDLSDFKALARNLAVTYRLNPQVAS